MERDVEEISQQKQNQNNTFNSLSRTQRSSGSRRWHITGQGKNGKEKKEIVKSTRWTWGIQCMGTHKFHFKRSTWELENMRLKNPLSRTIYEAIMIKQFERKLRSWIWKQQKRENRDRKRGRNNRLRNAISSRYFFYDGHKKSCIGCMARTSSEKWATLGSRRWSRFHSFRCWLVRGQSQQHRFLVRSPGQASRTDPNLDQQEPGLFGD